MPSPLACCKLRGKLAQKHGALLELMKWSIQSPEYGQTRAEYAQDVLQKIPFQLDPAPRKEADLVTSWNPRVFMASMLHSVKDSELRPSLHEKFYRTLTNQGIGYTFNAEAVIDLYRDDNPFFSVFAKVMNPQPKQTQWDTYQVQHAYESGPKAASKMVIQLDEHLPDYEKVTAGIDKSFFPPKYEMNIELYNVSIVLQLFFTGRLRRPSNYRCIPQRMFQI